MPEERQVQNKRHERRKYEKKLANKTSPSLAMIFHVAEVVP